MHIVKDLRKRPCLDGTAWRLSTGDDKLSWREKKARPQWRASGGSAISSHVSRVRWPPPSAPLLGSGQAPQAKTRPEHTRRRERPPTPHAASFAIHGTAA